jgi:ACS family tartrate transporter-like MFS transporter
MVQGTGLGPSVGVGSMADTGADGSRADAILARAARRLIPVMALMYVASFLDRVNIGFAALTMNRDLGFSPEVFGFGAGIFFFGYFFFEVPSNLVLEKVGARIWMCRIMVSWGLVSMATAFVTTAFAFYVLRFLLGLAEAGLYPGMILYMTYWFPQATRARFIALFLAAVPAASVVGAPISGWLLGFNGALHGWQWMLLLEGVPSLLLGVAVLWLLPDRPANAAWLSAADKEILEARLAADRLEDSKLGALSGFWEMLADKRIWIFIIPDFSIVIGLYGMGLWMPQMIKGLGFSNLETGFLVALPYFVSMVGMVLLGLSSDRSGERIWHVAGAAFAAALGLLGAGLLHGAIPVMASFCLAAAGIYGALAVFWTLPTAMLRGMAAAGGLALLNSFSNLGGFFGPYLMGWLKQSTGSYTLGMSLLAAMLGLAGISTVLIGRAFFPPQLDSLSRS